MANKMAARFSLDFQSDGTSTTLVVDLTNDPVTINVGGSPPFRLKNFEVGFPTDVTEVTGPDGTGANIASATIDQHAKTMTITFRTPFGAGDSGLSGVFLF
jgi:hypothetical protein